MLSLNIQGFYVTYCTYCNIVQCSPGLTSAGPMGLSKQEAQLSTSDRAMRLVSSNLANYHATVQKLLIQQVLTKPMV